MLREKIKEFIKVSGVVTDMATIAEKANAFMLDQVKEDYPPDILEEIRVLNDKYMTLVQARLDEFTEKFIDLYAEFYNEEDMDALLAYYQSPIAKKHREVSGKMLSRSLEISADFNKELLKQLDGATLNRQMN